MRSWKLGLLCACALALPPATARAGAPPQLHNKTIFLSWALQIFQKAPDGRIVNPRVDVERAIYVSSAGRLFARTTRGINNRVFRASKTGEMAPGENRTAEGQARDLHFEGNTLIGSLAFASGASRMVVTFDASFSGCSLSIIFGKAGGAAMRWRGLDGQMYEVQSVNAVGPSCSLRDGNVFAGQ